MNSIILWGSSQFLKWLTLCFRLYSPSTSSVADSRDRSVVRTLRCGRSNPGSIPGHGISFFIKIQLIEFFAIFFCDFFICRAHHLCEGGYACDFLGVLTTRQFSKKSHHHRKQKIARVAAALTKLKFCFFLCHSIQSPVTSLVAHSCMV